MAGPFRNTVPLRIVLDEQETAAGLLHRVDAARTAVTAYEYMPEPLIREWSDPSLARAWLYAHVVTFAQPPAALYQPAGLTAQAVPLPGSWHPRPLGLTVRRRTGAELDCELVFCTTMIGQQAARRFGAHLATLTRGLVATPGAPLRDATMLSGQERVRLLHGWNDTSTPVPAGARIEDLIRPWAGTRPDATAVRAAAGSLTYRELLARADGWAAALRQAGAGPGDLVGVHMRRTPDLVAALLGTFLAGAAYVPLDPAYPGPRLTMIASDAGLRVVLDDTGRAPERLLAGRTAVTAPAPGSFAAPAPPVSADGLAYVLYTSGSTGRPKGVEIRHRNAVNMILWAASMLGEDLAGFLATTSVNFDCSIMELFATLSAGGTVLLCDRPLSGAALRAAAGARVINGVPSVVAEALAEAELPSSVTTVILGGEPPWPSLVARIRASGSVRRILNLYGPTETTSYSTMAQIGATLAHPPPIGRPITNTRTYVLDRYQNLVPAGVTGELYIGGAGVARGYRGLPDLTAERFLPDTLSGAPDGHLYRTGDLVRHTEDGDLLFVGRADTQVKVHGVRIETGEIEHVLTTLDGVAEAVVLADRGENEQVTLAAWVTPSDGACLAGPAVRGELAGLLPSAMIPARIFVTDELPRTPNGKVDRQELRARGRRPHPATAAPPRTPLERWLAGLWQDLLAIGQIGAGDDFFELGGDSFLAMRMIGRAQEAGHPVEPADIYTAPTVAALAAVITARSATGQRTPLPGAVGAAQ
jgi:amino acid adenylation domain-containing protein